MIESIWFMLLIIARRPLVGWLGERLAERCPGCGGLVALHELDECR